MAKRQHSIKHLEFAKIETHHHIFKTPYKLFCFILNIWVRINTYRTVVNVIDDVEHQLMSLCLSLVFIDVAEKDI